MQISKFGFFHDKWKHKYVMFNPRPIENNRDVHLCEVLSEWLENFIRSQGLNNLVFNQTNSYNSTQILFKVKHEGEQVIDVEYKLTKIRLHQAPAKGFSKVIK